MAASPGNRDASGRILLNKSNVFEQMGDSESALVALREAAPFVEASEDPNLLFALRFNTADNLCHLKLWDEAAGLLSVVRELAVQHGGEMNRLRVIWLESRTAAGLGRTEEAQA